jgi:hypothetical protein
MKINLTVDIDWLNEDESLDEMIQEKIIKEVVDKVSDGVINSVKNEAEKRVVDQVESLVTKTYEAFMDNGVTITDRWGDPTEKDVKIKDLIKQRCDKWLTEQVDKEGRASRDSWGGNQTRMEHFIDQQIQKQTKSMSEQIVKKVNDEMKKFITDSLKNSIGEKLVKEIGIEELLKKVSK